jgi:HK97 family phage major capsid protein
MSLFKMKESLSVVGNELRTVSEELRSLAMAPETKIEELREKQKYQAEVQERFDLLKAEVEKEERANAERMRASNPTAYAGTDEQRRVAATADFIRSSFAQKGLISGSGEISEETRNLLGAIPAPHSSGGEKLLPVNLQRTLISEPFTRNPLREVVAMSSIVGLELPKIAYTIDDDSFIVDGATAKEIKLTGDKVSFGRKKFKVIAKISDTVMHGSDLELTSYVQNALNSGLAAKEKKVMLTEAPIAGEEHMSFYSTQNNIAKVSGANLYKAIKAALADLHEDYRENARITMRFADYMDIIEMLANKNATFYEAPPERVLGKPTVFSDSAVNPIVGDFNFTRLNYDGPLVYDNDKDVKTGDYLFVITAWFDVQVLLKSAFRIAAISVTP